MSDRLKGILEKAKGFLKEDSSTILPENLPFGLDERVLRFFTSNPLPTDKAFHKFAIGINVNPSQAEENAYILATIGAMFVAGGDSNREGVGEKDVDPEELKKGIEIEAEHTLAGDDPIRKFIQKRISMDHFAESGKVLAIKNKYYTHLIEMEHTIEKEVKGEKTS